MSGGISRIRYTPAARPVDTVGVDTSFQEMARPVSPVNPLAPSPLPNVAPPPVNTQAQELAQALSNFGGVVGKVGQSFDEQIKADTQREAEYAALKSNASNWEEAVRSDPSLASRSPWFRDVFEARVASNTMLKKVGELQVEYLQDPIRESTNPSDIQKWFMDRIQTTMDSFKNPAEKAAAVEEATKQAQAFSRAHLSNSTQNLIKQNEQSYQEGTMTRLDRLGATAPTQGGKVGDFASKDLTPVEMGILAGIAQGESNQRYDVRYTARGGASFPLNGQHPNIAEPIPWNPGKTSSAAGRYQFLHSTWKQVMGDAEFSPENQDKAALKLAREVYAQKTGRNLDEDFIADGGLSDRIQNSLSDTWEAFKRGNRAAHMAASQEAYMSGRGAQADSRADKSGRDDPRRPGGASGELPSPDLDAAAADQWRAMEGAMRQGARREQVEQYTVDAVVTKAIQDQNSTFLGILSRPMPDGRVLSDDPQVRQRVMQAEQQIQSLQVQKNNSAVQQARLAKQAAVDDLKSKVFTRILDRQTQGQDGSIDTETMKLATQLDPDLYTSFSAINKNIADGNKQEDPSVINDLSRRLYSGQMTVDDVFDAFQAGAIRDPSTLKTFYAEAQANHDKSYLTHPLLQRALGAVDQLLNDPSKYDPDKRIRSLTVQMTLREDFKKFMETNPQATLKQQDDHLQGAIKAVLSDIQAENNSPLPVTIDDASKTDNQPSFWDQMFGGSSKSTTKAAETGKPSSGTSTSKPQETLPVAISEAPKGNLQDWRTTSRFSDPEAFNAAVEEYRINKSGQLAEMIRQYGLKTPDDIADFMVAQRGLLTRKK